MLRYALIVPALLLLSACEPTVDDYVKDAELRKEKLSECSEMGVLAAKDDKYCQMAFEAQGIAIKQAAGSLIDAITMQSDEGEEISEDARPEHKR